MEEQKEWQSLELRTIKINVSLSYNKCYHNVGLGIIDMNASRRCGQVWAVARERVINQVVVEVDVVRAAFFMAQKNE